MSGTKPTSAERQRLHSLCARLNGSPYYKLLGLHAECDHPGTSRVTLRYTEQLTQMYGGIHGGALMSLADAAINFALLTALAEGEANASVSITVDFLAPAGRGDVVAEGTVIRKGGRVSFGECVLRAGEQEVARGHGVCYVGSKARIDRGA